MVVAMAAMMIVAEIEHTAELTSGPRVDEVAP
jgi:hypothetical protein